MRDVLQRSTEIHEGDRDCSGKIYSYLYFNDILFVIWDTEIYWDKLVGSLNVE